EEPVQGGVGRLQAPAGPLHQAQHEAGFVIVGIGGRGLHQLLPRMGPPPGIGLQPQEEGCLHGPNQRRAPGGEPHEPDHHPGQPPAPGTPHPPHLSPRLRQRQPCSCRLSPGDGPILRTIRPDGAALAVRTFPRLWATRGGGGRCGTPFPAWRPEGTGPRPGRLPMGRGGGIPMPMDGLFLAAVRAELNEVLVGGHVQKIFQPTARSIVLHTRTPGQSHRLLASVEPGGARLQRTELDQPHPPVPPAFCMLLRKYLEGSRFYGARQEGLERLLALRFERGPKEAAEAWELMLELTGRQGNLVLVDEDGTVLDAIVRVPPGAGPRTLIPGVPYEPPP